ncbi:MAG: endonuclease [Gammaproteobacteria bacterium]|nr:endonuclease [Gammaproteobacteria bacterium]
MKHKQLLIVYQSLLEAYGALDWWPADSTFVVMVGAILTHNTAWTNVEKAITNLRHSNCLTLERVLASSDVTLAQLIRPSGYFNIKAKRLKNLCLWVEENGGEARLAVVDTASLRSSLLEVNGVGPETADDILLYAFERPVFVIDTYTRRLFTKLGLIEGNEPYEALRQIFEVELEPNVSLFNQYHALIVRHAKEICMKRSDCRHCQVEDNKTQVI